MGNTMKWIIAVLFLSASITVSSAAVLSINTPSYGTKGETLTVTVLWDVAPAPGADVYFVLDGGTPSHGQTDASGQVKYKPLLTGNLNITAIYEGITTGKEISVYEPTPTYIPPAPAGLASTQGNFWINYTWQEGIGNVTDSYNVSVNGTWTNGTVNNYSNDTVGPHGWSNITVFSFNSSGTGRLNETPETENTQVANNAPVLAPISDKIITAGNWLNFTVSATDPDSDPITNATNATKGDFDNATGEFSWLPTPSDVGTYVWEFNSTDSYGSVANQTIRLEVFWRPNITAFSIDSSGKLGHTLNASVTIKNDCSVALNNVTIVVSGLHNSTGYPIYGTGAVNLEPNLDPGNSTTLRVLVYVPASADTGNYTVFADAWLYEDYPDVTKTVHRGPEVTSVTS